MSFVLDSSVALSWCFPDENDARAREFLDRAKGQVLLVPALWHIETTNILGMSFRKGRLSESELEAALRVLASLTIHTDTLVPLPRNLLTLMEKHGLTAYDASYLELASRHGISLATFDRPLAEAAKKVGIPLMSA